MTYHIQGMLAPHGSARAIGQLFSMDAQTQAALQDCSNKCEQQYGASSGRPDAIQIALCFASCNMQYPPAVAIPGGGTVTPTPVVTPGVPGSPVDPFEPGATAPPETPPLTTGASAGSDMKMWIIGGAVALAAAGAFFYFKK